jgi:hypothetical protein
VRHHDEAGTIHELLERFRCLFQKRRVARCRDLVGNVHIEVERQRQRKLQSRLHPGRIGFHRLVECIPEFSKLLDISNKIGKILFVAMDAADEFGILPPGQDPLQSSAKPHRPGDSTTAFNLPTSWLVGPAD